MPQTNNIFIFQNLTFLNNHKNASTKSILKFVSCFFSIILFVSYSFGQEQQEVKIRAEDAYSRGEYAYASYLFEYLRHEKKMDAKSLMKLADCYEQINSYKEATIILNELIEKHPNNITPDVWYRNGLMLKSIGRYDDAKKSFLTYAYKTGKNVTDQTNGCDSAIVWLSHPSNSFEIKNISQINTSGSDWGAQLYDKNQIVFVSDSLRTTKLIIGSSILNGGNAGSTNRNYQKIYKVDTSDYNGIDRDFVRDFSPVINKNRYHVGPISFSKNEDSAYFTLTYTGNAFKDDKIVEKNGHTVSYGTRRSEIFLVKKNKYNEWSKPTPFIWNKPSQYSIGQPVLSRDGKIIYFSSDMPGGKGKSDIWYCERKNDTTWSIPQNCGSSINTSEDEEFPTIGLDSSLYFSSGGHIGIGGLDIFKAYGEKNKWLKVKNMETPINSPGDDFYYSENDEFSGFFSSNREGGKGNDDIYSYNRKHVYFPLMVTVIDKYTGLKIEGVHVKFMTDNGKKLDTLTDNVGIASANFMTPFTVDITVFKLGYKTARRTIVDTALLSNYNQVFVLEPNERPIAKDSFNIDSLRQEIIRMRITMAANGLLDTTAPISKINKIRKVKSYIDLNDVNNLLSNIVTNLRNNPDYKILLCPNQESDLIPYSNRKIITDYYDNIVSYLTSRGIESNRISLDNLKIKNPTIITVRSCDKLGGIKDHLSDEGLIMLLIYKDGKNYFRK